MVAKSFEIGDLVWAKMKGYPPWPGKVVDPPEEAKSSKVKKAQHYIFFYGSKNHAWMADENIVLHNEKLVEQYATKTRSAVYLSAVETIVQASKSSSKYQKPLESSFEKITSKEFALPKSKSPHTNSVVKKEIKKKVPLKKFPEPKKVARKRASSTDHNGADNIGFAMSPSKIQKHDADYSSLYANIPPNNGQESSIYDNLGETVDPSTGLLAHPHVERESTPPVDLISENMKLKLKNIVPSEKKIGFLGLGKLGQGMVKNLLKSGHSVTIWNRTREKCQQFVDIGAERVATPSDVVVACDIIFCCVADSEVAKDLVFGNCGVLKGLDASQNETKGYVEMTALDPKTSETISDEISLHGGRYLEAPLSGGSRVQADEGTLLILGAGDKTLFEECKSCFSAMGKQAVFVGKVGIASRFNIVHNMLLGTVYAAVAESMALINRVGLHQSDFLDILQFSALNGPVVIDKAQSMMEQKYTSNTPLKHIQSSLNLGLMLGGLCEQPMPITAAANEVYKHCKLLRYGDHDVSAVYEGTRR